MRRNGAVSVSAELLMLLVLSLTFIQMLLEPTMESVPVLCGVYC